MRLLKHLLKTVMMLLAYTASAQTPRINFNAPLLYPEGTAYNSATNQFFVSSVTTGTIGTVDLNGNIKSFMKTTRSNPAMV